jgi:fructose-bisphosphate aldolase class II
MVKVNIGTALNSAFTGTVRGTLEHDAAPVDPRCHLASRRIAMADTLARVLRLLAATTTRAR